MHIRNRCLLIAVLALALASGLRAQESWQTATSPTAQNLWSVCYGNGQFVAVGEGGTILTSSDGTTWKAQNSGTTRWLVGVAWSNDLGLYAAVGDQGTILTSPDAITWTVRSSSGDRLNGVSYCADRFVAVGEAGAIRTSIDGSVWSLLFRPTSNYLHGIAFGSSVWLASGKSSTGVYSMSGASFALSAIPVTSDFESVAYGRGVFLAVGGAGKAASTTSPSGNATALPWITRNTGTAADLRAVIYAHNGFVAAAADGAVYLTPDGVASWRKIATSTTQVLNSVAASDSAFVCVGFGGTLTRAPVAVLAPTLITPPITQPALARDNVMLRAVFSGAGLQYQWAFNGVPIAGETTDVLFMKAVTADQAGTYSVTATNSAGSLTANAVLTVVTKTDPVDLGFALSPVPSTVPRVVYPLSDGKVLLGGDFTLLINSQPVLGLIRLNSNGSIDPTFDVGSGVNGAVNTIAQQADGKLLVGGKFSTFNGVAANNLIRLNTDGSLDRSFTPAAIDISSGTDVRGVLQLVVQSDGKILVVTAFKPLVRLLPETGAADTGFNQVASLQSPAGTAADVFPRFLTLDPIGRIVACDTAGVFRILANGLCDSTVPRYAAAAPAGCYAACQADGTILVANPTYSSEGLVRLTSALAVDPSFHADLNFTAPSSSTAAPPFAVAADGKIWVAGSFTRAGGLPRYCFARFNADGTIDATYRPAGGPDSNGVLNSVVVQPDGKPIVVGTMTYFAAQSRRYVTRLNPNSFSLGEPCVVGFDSDLVRVQEGDQAQFTAKIVGSSPSASWFRAGSTGSSYGSTNQVTFSYVRASDVGAYYVSVFAPAILFVGSSQPVYLGILPSPPRFATTTPASIIAPSDRNLTLTTDITGASPITYQWFLNNNPISGATASTYTMYGGGIVQGSYTLVARNAYGVAVSNPTHVTVESRSLLINLSTRASVMTGDNVLIAGFVIDGPGTKRLLIRGVGGTLAQPVYGLSGLNLDDPELTLYDSSGKILRYQADLPAGGTEATTATQVGAFALTAATDSAIIADLPAGAYSVKISPQSKNGLPGPTGIGLAEIYEVDKNASRLVNLSARAFVGTGAAVTIPGFVVGPGQSRKVLIRGAGPALANYGVSGVLADPRIRLVDADGNTVASNDDWGTGPNAGDVAASIIRAQAFAFDPGSKDAALVATLPPGRYSALVEGANGGTGVALVEVYQLQ